MLTASFERRPLSLRGIADALGVSTATVSWVLSGQGDAKGISAATQKKVQDFAQAHNYRPNMLARGLSLGPTKTLGLIISSLSDPFYSSIAKAVVSEAGKSGYTVMIATSESDSEKERTLVSSLHCRRVDGIIITPTEGAAWMEKDAVAGGNIVLVDRSVSGLSTPSVVVDNEESAFRLVSHLLKKGRRKIAIVTTAHNLVNMQARHAGYERALREAGIEADSRLVCQVPPDADIRQINAELDRLLRDVPDLDGIFFTSHVLVLPTYVHFAERGIPTGRGEQWACLPDFELLLPGMSIAQMPIFEMGARAVDMLLHKSSAKEGASPVILPCKIELR